MEGFKVVGSKPSSIFVDQQFIENRIDASYYSFEYISKELKEEKSKLIYENLEELGKNFSYGTPPYGHISDNGIPYLRIPDIEEEFFLNDKEFAFIDEEYHKQNIRNEVRSGDILFRIKGQLGQALVVPERFSGSHTGSSFLRFSPVNIDGHFLVVYLSSSFGKNQILRKQSNSIIQYLNIDDIKSIRIPRPKIEIQKYIGDKIRKAEELREKAKRLKREAEKIFENELHIDMNFIDKNQDRETWVTENKINEGNITADYYKKIYLEIEKRIDKSESKFYSLEEITNGILLGNTKKVSAYYSDEGVPYITTKNIKQEGVDFSSLLYIPKNIHDNDLKKSKAFPNDILYNKSGNVGLSSILGDEYNEYNVVSDIIIIRPDIEKINAYYLVLFLNSKLGKNISERMAGGAIFQHISIYDIVKIKVPILPFDIQTTIGNKKMKSELYNKKSKKLIEEAKKDIEDLIEGNFDMSKLKEVIKMV